MARLSVYGTSEANLGAIRGYKYVFSEKATIVQFHFLTENYRTDIYGDHSFLVVFHLVLGIGKRVKVRAMILLRLFLICYD